MNVLLRWLILAVFAVGGVYFAGLFGPIPPWPFHGLGVSVVPAGLIAVSAVGSDCPATLDGVAARLGVPADLESVKERVRQVLAALPGDVCHSFVRDGLIEFLGDCTHPLAGRTVPLEPF